MIIDLILDRRDGCAYDPQEFAAYVHDCIDIFPDCGAAAIDSALGCGCEQKVRHELCAYVLDGGYPPEICDFINSVCWLPDWWERS